MLGVLKAGGRIHLEGYMINCVLAGIFAVASVCAAAAIAISLRALRLVDWERQVAGFRRFEAAGCTRAERRRRAKARKEVQS